ncbi:MAG: hemerythrin family protein [Rhodospirillaceae bacterium]|jgi:hemerythrin-like metal-binding protein|nr:hemerythrin family protein [Rhodospirillaceae bacterium]MBT4938781.1 hemerythrin family protein [Rhodospirillaceae bacterium]MBT5938681.1 hemerythrin family protein [Rhodospirillaceae bacterium]MBT7266485.1 hemerythrin family protein [Rhodospirillaceae bacterium]
MSENVFELPTKLLIGHATIDEDHARLVRIINETGHALQKKQFQESTRLIVEFIEGMKAHFVTEEDILMETKFPWIEEHVASHRQVILKLPRLIDDSEKVMDGEQGWNKLVDELVECLMDDTFKADMMFKSFLEKQST